MLVKWWIEPKFKRAPEGGEGGSGGAATGTEDVLFNSGGNGAGDSGKDTGVAGKGNETSGGGNGGNNANGGGNENSKVVIPENWQGALPEEVRIPKYKTVEELARGYKNLEKMQGAEKIAIPQKGTPLDQMKEVFQKLGLPGDVKDYVVDTTGMRVDKGFVDAFRESAFKLGVLPQQANELAKWFDSFNTKSFDDQVKQAAGKIKADLDGLKEEWGDKYDSEVVAAKLAMTNLFTPEQQQALKDAGLGTNVNFIKGMAKAGKFFKEDSMRGDGSGNQNGQYTPEEAKAKIKEITSDAKSPYYDKDHVDHKKVKDQVTGLYAMAYPKPAQK